MSVAAPELDETRKSLLADPGAHSAPHLLGRRGELEAIFGVVDALSERGGSLVLRGRAGAGKTALLNAASSRAAASGALVLSTAGVRSEADLAFSSLHQLLMPVLSGSPDPRRNETGVDPRSQTVRSLLDVLPEPQCEALATVFGLSAGPAPDRFLVGLGVLTLLSGASSTRPVLCLVDDAQWLDRASAQTLAFIARRLFAESVALLFAVREPTEDLGGLPEQLIDGLGDEDARALFRAVARGPLDERVCARIVAEARGIPLSLLEVARELSREQLAGFGMPDTAELPTTSEEAFLRRLRALPDETGLLLLVAAAEPTGDPQVLWMAAERLGITRAALAPAVADGLLEVEGCVRFLHPVARSVIYRAAPVDERQRVHSALAGATDPEADAERHAWHRAHATEGQDEDVAAELEHCAHRAFARGGLAASATFLERAVALTPDSEQRARRAIEAADVKYQAGSPEAALGLLATADTGPLSELDAARADLLRAQIALSSVGDINESQLLLRAARRIESLDPNLARDTYLEALSVAEFAGHLAHSGTIRDVARAARAAPPRTRPPRPADLMMDGLARRFTEGFVPAVPTLQKAVAAFRRDRVAPNDELRWLWLGCRTAGQLWDVESWDALSSRLVRLAREAGALAVLPRALSVRICALTLIDGPAAAATLSEELQADTEGLGIHTPPYGALLLAAWRGRETESRKVIDSATEELALRQEGFGLVATQWASAVMLNGLGRYEDAFAAAELASEHADDLPFSSWGLIELIVAAVRTERNDHAIEAQRRLAQLTSACGTEWALGAEALTAALVSDTEAEKLYREAIKRLDRARLRVWCARAQLLYGEWLRRERRRLDARETLRIARERLVVLGTEAFVERAERELMATGERARRRTAETRDALTARERQIASLAQDGLSNPEIGAQLFISPRTVEYHLHKVFAKLGVSSRNQLRGALPRN